MAVDSPQEMREDEDAAVSEQRLGLRDLKCSGGECFRVGSV
ncbi:hypothetical protein [Actinomyces faecalis]|nr:hypothetical protein [Actinomyces faecalis]